MDRQDSVVHYRSSPQSKIALFRSLFRGRDDVYPRRFENSRTGKSGYAPACGNEWVRGLCEKPSVKCGDCSHQCFLPLTDDVIRWHLSGEDEAGRDFVMGVYPMLRDETCFLLADGPGVPRHRTETFRPVRCLWFSLTAGKLLPRLIFPRFKR